MTVPNRIMTATVTAALVATVGTPALAGEKGKTSGGCSNPYTFATYDSNGHLYVNGNLSDPLQRNEDLLNTPGIDPLAIGALFASLDHNGDNGLCYKLPDGWTSGNTANRDGFVNLVDNKS